MRKNRVTFEVDKIIAQHVRVIDEAGMTSSSQLERVLVQAERANAIVVGDPEELQPRKQGRHSGSLPNVIA